MESPYLWAWVGGYAQEKLHIMGKIMSMQNIMSTQNHTVQKTLATEYQELREKILFSGFSLAYYANVLQTLPMAHV